MPNYAIIQNGKVVNTVVADADHAQQNGWVLLTENAGIDWDYVNGQFVDNRPKPQPVAQTTLTKDDLLAQLQSLQAKINALGA